MQNEGLARVASPHSVEETIERLRSILKERNLQVFALIDHSGEAAKVGMKMLPTKLLIFGSPKGGTPVMVAAPSIAIDLPLKALVSEDESGKVSGHIQHPGVSAATAQCAWGSGEEYFRRGSFGGEGRGIMARRSPQLSASLEL